MKRRLVSAAIGMPVVAAAVLLGWPATAVAAAVAALAAGWEVAGLAAAGGLARAALTLAPVAAVAAGIGVAAGSPGLFGAAAVAAALLSVLALPGRRTGAASYRFLVVAAALYFGIMLGHAAPLSAATADGYLWLAFALLVTFAVDTAAYFTGRAIGRRKMAPSISPGKTWEGTAGGLAAGTAAGAALSVIFGSVAAAGEFSIGPAAGAGLGLVMGVAAVLGDLAESWLKRRAGVKDAGGLIPGHGGFLDRLDSLAPNLAIVYYARIWASG